MLSICMQDWFAKTFHVIALRSTCYEQRKTFCVGFVAHYFNFLREDIFVLAEIGELTKIRSVVTFLKIHKYVHAEFPKQNQKEWQNS